MEREEIPKRKMTTIDIILKSIETIFFLAQAVVCFKFFNYMRLKLVVYIGMAILLIALLLGWLALMALKEKGEQHVDKIWMYARTEAPIGVYAVVRHPLYLSFLLLSLTLLLLSQHALTTLLFVIIAGLLDNDMYREDQGNIKKFGNEYRQYMEQVPRMNVLLGIIRYIRRKKRKRE